MEIHFYYSNTILGRAVFLSHSIHMTPTVASLYWLPDCFGIDFEIVMIAFKAPLGLAPEYVTDLQTP